MKRFAGFPDGPLRMTPVPEPFFTELLTRIDDLGELKVSMYALWRLSQQEGSIRYLTLTEMSADKELLSALETDAKPAEQSLRDALERAADRGTLIAVRVGSSDEICYFLHSPRGRAAAEGLAAGKWMPDQIPHAVRRAERPNVFALYEQNIGVLTPMAAEILRDAEKEYPAGWIEEAIRIAVEHNARSWKYAAAILERWKKEGRGEKKTSAEEERRRYVEGEYADFIEH